MAFVKVGNKLVEVDSNGVAKCTSREIKHADGRIDIEVHVPSLKIVSKQPTKEK